MARRKFDLDSLPSNNQNEPERERLEVVATGRVKTRKRGGLANNVRTIGNSLFAEIILPSVKSAIVDFFSNGVNMVMFGQGSTGPRRGGPVPYNQQYQNQREPSRIRRVEAGPRVVQQVEEVFDDVYFRERHEAENVLGRMMERIAEYGWVSVGELNSLTGLSPSYSAERWVWYDLHRVHIHYTGDGYLIGFPDPVWRN